MEHTQPQHRRIQPAFGTLALTLTLGSAMLCATVAQARPGQSPSRPEPTITPAAPTTRPTPPARPTTTPPNRPQPPAGDIKLLEGALGRTLTDAEKAAITAAVVVRDTAVQAAKTNFEAQVAAIFGLSVSGLQAKIKSSQHGRGDKLGALLEGALGRTLTTDEIAAIKLAATTRDESIKAAHDVYRAAVAAALGLTVAELDAKIQAFLAANGTKPESPKGDKKPSDPTVLLPAVLGRALTTDELAAITLAITTRDAAVKAAQASFNAQVAAALGLTLEELQAKIRAAHLKGHPKLDAVLAAALGRALTADEIAAVKAAISARDTACKAANDTFKASLAAAVGLSVADLDAQIKAYLAAHGKGS